MVHPGSSLLFAWDEVQVGVFSGASIKINPHNLSWSSIKFSRKLEALMLLPIPPNSTMYSRRGLSSAIWSRMLRRVSAPMPLHLLRPISQPAFSSCSCRLPCRSPISHTVASPCVLVIVVSPTLFGTTTGSSHSLPLPGPSPLGARVAGLVELLDPVSSPAAKC